MTRSDVLARIVLAAIKRHKDTGVPIEDAVQALCELDPMLAPYERPVLNVFSEGLETAADFAEMLLN